jgi:hypothetical protein
MLRKDYDHKRLVAKKKKEGKKKKEISGCHPQGAWSTDRWS